MKIGRYTVECIIDGFFGLDGGAMFGIVPRPLWERGIEPDERNRIRLAARCLLLRDERRNILVETGIGAKFDARRADIFAIEHPRGGLVPQLAARGVAAHDITDVVLTHLHFDHCGGTTQRRGDDLSLTFPRATYHLQRQQWEWAANPSGKDSGSYRQEDFALLETAALSLLDGDTEILEGVRLVPVHGHTPGMQIVRIAADDGPGVLFCADLVPTKLHLRGPYIMAYDNQPLQTLAEKQHWLPQIAACGDAVVFGHDATIDAAVLRCADDGGVVIEREIGLGEL